MFFKKIKKIIFCFKLILFLFFKLLGKRKNNKKLSYIITSITLKKKKGGLVPIENALVAKLEFTGRGAMV
jgi:hypothetical protein